jgi:hypothetical protein
MSAEKTNTEEQEPAAIKQAEPSPQAAVTGITEEIIKRLIEAVVLSGY